jgi:hypothetical protein
MRFRLCFSRLSYFLPFAVNSSRTGTLLQFAAISPHSRFSTLQPASSASPLPNAADHVPLPPPTTSKSKLGPDESKYFNDADDTSTSSGGGGCGSDEGDAADALRARLLDAALGHVPVQGWTNAALAAAVSDLGLSAQSAGAWWFARGCLPYFGFFCLPLSVFNWAAFCPTSLLQPPSPFSSSTP